MESKTAVEVLKEVYELPEHYMADWPFHSNLDFVLHAMKSYARQVATEATESQAMQLIPFLIDRPSSKTGETLSFINIEQFIK